VKRIIDHILTVIILAGIFMFVLGLITFVKVSDLENIVLIVGGVSLSVTAFIILRVFILLPPMPAVKTLSMIGANLMMAVGTIIFACGIFIPDSVRSFVSPWIPVGLGPMIAAAGYLLTSRLDPMRDLMKIDQ